MPIETPVGFTCRATRAARALTPAGRHIEVNDRPLGMVLSPNGQSLAVVTGSNFDPRALRSKLSLETGLRAAAVFPVRAGGRIVAVLEFTSRRIRPPDKRLWQTLGAIGTQVGQFLVRLEAERAVRESESRFRALTNLSSDWYWELDSNYCFTRLEGRNVAGGDPGALGDQQLCQRDVAVRADDGQPLPVHELPGGLKLTVLGPDRRDLLRLKDQWLVSVEEEGLAYATVEEALAALSDTGRLQTEQTYLSEEPRPDI